MASFYEGDGDDAGMEVGGSGVPAPAAAPTPAENVPSASGGHINFVSDDQDDDSDSEQQAFYAGGSTNSGNMVSSPPRSSHLVYCYFLDPRTKEEESDKRRRFLQSIQRGWSRSS